MLQTWLKTTSTKPDKVSHIKAKVANFQAMKAYRSRGTATHIINLGTRWRWWKTGIQFLLWVFMICHVKALLDGGEWSTSSPLLYPQKITASTYWTEGWEGPRIVLDLLEKQKKFFLLPDLLPCNLVAVVNETYWIPAIKIRDNISMLLLL